MSFKHVINPHIKKSVVTIAIALALLVELAAEIRAPDLPTFAIAIRGSSALLSHYSNDLTETYYALLVAACSIALV